MKLSKAILCGMLISVPILANAGDLKIANRTKFDLSFKVNNICSDKFGLVLSDTIKVIAEKDFKHECEANPKVCRTIVYKRPNCEGGSIGEVGFDTNYGVSYISGSTSGEKISITGNGFNLIFSAPLKA